MTEKGPEGNSDDQDTDFDRRAYGFEGSHDFSNNFKFPSDNTIPSDMANAPNQF